MRNGIHERNRIAKRPRAGQLTLEWREDETFSPGIRRTRVFQPINVNQRERTCYVKLVIDLPDYCVSRGVAWIRRSGGDGSLDRPSVICGVSGSVSGFDDLRPQTGLRIA